MVGGECPCPLGKIYVPLASANLAVQEDLVIKTDVLIISIVLSETTEMLMTVYDFMTFRNILYHLTIILF